MKANPDSASPSIDGMAGRSAAPTAWRQTRQQRQREETIDRLLDCSKFILQRDGHAMFTLRAVATHAGVRLSGLQHYFDSKEHLLVETVRQAIESDFNRYRNYALQPDSDPVATLTKILDHAFEIVSDPVETGLMLELWALSRHSPEVHGILQNRFRQYFDIVTHLVQAINATLDDAAAAAIAEVLIGNLEGIIVTVLTMGELRSDYHLVRANILRSWEALYRR